VIRYAWLVVLIGCVNIDISDEHRCTMDADCTRGGIQGTCEPVGNCSFADPACAPTERRFDEFSGERSGLCVGDVP
jgi:hypothetical protein